MNKIPVGISGCLLGEEVRYNGGHKHDAYITGTLADYFEFTSFCPEMGAGLGVPRPPIRLAKVGDSVRAVGVKDSSRDVTDQLQDYSQSQQDKLAELCGFILKKGSPSCGMERVKLFNDKGIPQPEGQGIFARFVSQQFPNLPLEEEGRLGNPVLRQNFIQRVFVYWRWKSLLDSGLTLHRLTGFHAQLKLVLMGHNQTRARELGALLATANQDNLEQVASGYISQVMAVLKIIATVKNHVNVLQHIQGYLKRELDRVDKAELVEAIEKYRLGEQPLLVPLTLLKHHFRKSPDPYIEQSWYMTPYPQALMYK